jgi:hypothetical protein
MRCSLLLAVLFLLSTSGCSIFVDSDSPAKIAELQQQEKLAVTATVLGTDYAKADRNARKQYIKKTLIITGVISGKAESYLGEPMLYMDDSIEIGDVTLAFSESAKMQLSKLKIGTQIRVSCFEISEDIITPVLSRCRL